MPRRREGKRMTVSPKTRAAGAIEQRSALGGAGRPQCRGGRHLLLLRSDHRRVLPSLLRRTAAAPGERAVPRHQGGSGAGRIPPLQAVPPRPSVARGTARRHRNGDLPPDRDLVPRPGARCAGRSGRDESVPLPPGVQGGDWSHAQGLRCRPPRRAGPPRARKGAHGHRGDLRLGVQLERPVLRRIGADAGHDADRVSRGRRQGRDPLRRRRVLAGLDPGRPERARGLRHLPGRRSRRADARAPGPLPPRHADRRRRRRSRMWWRRWSD